MNRARCGDGGRNGDRGRGFDGQWNDNRSRGRGFVNVMDQYYSPQEWSNLTPEQQQRVRDLRADRGRRRGVQVVDVRNVRARNDASYSNIPNSVGNSTISTNNINNSQNVGALMSQRTSNNGNANQNANRGL
jgi:hypothetical protein